MTKSKKTVTKKPASKKVATKKPASKKSPVTTEESPVTTEESPVTTEESPEVTTEESPEESPEVTTVVEKKEPVKRKKPDKESVLKLIDELSDAINEEIGFRRESDCKVSGVRFLRKLDKCVKKIRTHSNRVMKTKNKKPRKVNQNSGFLKPVPISKELSCFTGFEGLVSRVAVTKFICNYIKENNLQNPEDRRKIMADKNLSRLLKHDKTKDVELTYYGIQSYLKPHFIKVIVE